MRLSVLNHFHRILVFGLASVTVHPKTAVCPSITLYGLETLDVTSGLYCILILISTASDVPAELLAVQLYDPDIFFCIFGTVNLDPL